MNKLEKLPNKNELLQKYSDLQTILDVSGHFHTPYSFSAFKNIEQVIELAQKENIKILGINDFYTTAGYNEFYDLCEKNKIFPLFNIEFIGLSKEMQAKGTRINDPNNPGRIYFSGKGLNFPANFTDDDKKLLESVKKESMVQITEMVNKASEHLTKIDANLTLTTNEILEKYAQDLVRERHIAKAIRIKIDEKYQSEADKKELYTKVYSGKEPTSDLNDIAQVEGEIRSNLLKKGGIAFVPEDEKAFLNLEQVQKVILNAGGIPCYPVLLDDKNGNYTDFEENKEQMLTELKAMNVFAIELIPGRNAFENLKPFVQFFDDNNFIVTFGTEHNSPKMIPLKITCTGGKELDNDLKKISYKGACVIAAHQYLKTKNEDGYVNKNGDAKIEQFNDFVKLGNAVIQEFIA